MKLSKINFGTLLMTRMRSKIHYDRLMPLTLTLVLMLTSVLVGGCGGKEQQTATPPPRPEVKVAEVVRKKIPIVMPFAGTVKSVQVIDIIPRVSGYINEVNFQEGSYVKKGDPLYLIDPRPFQARVNALEAQIEKDQASVAFWTSEAERYTRLASKGAGSVEDKEKAIARRDEMLAKVDQDKADLENAKLDLSFTRITAPFDGRIEDTKKYPGALVQAQRDVLTTLVQIDPIHVIFNMSRRQVAQVQALQRKGLAPSELEDYKIEIFLPDGTRYDHQGHIDFVSAQIDPKTDTQTVRAVISNEAATKFQVKLASGQYVPVNLIAGHQPDALLIPGTALVQSQIGSHVFVVGKDGKAETRPVEVDRAYDNQWVISQGLEKGERIVVDGVQKVRSGVVVKISDGKAKGVEPS
jgi:RND family efflux transporter MFP subunit